jgi:hypothetical protein
MRREYPFHRRRNLRRKRDRRRNQQRGQQRGQQSGKECECGFQGVISKLLTGIAGRFVHGDGQGRPPTAGVDLGVRSVHPARPAGPEAAQRQRV